ncbi:nucleoside/nucleotide kinase family protein [Bifidobacterium stellenboschense]|uniref:Panthothenate kinase n=1 Tax=Bifidobacterium stellenboschense TaxID=762211 RepID=A0A087DFH5_9BIFI|nr:nucleoside/nucleotide kinase family protein [Bifidobacterium stellenboschense]KFI94275.1 panthothenate kinase [Bifidobacterium stellenboschense]
MTVHIADLEEAKSRVAQLLATHERVILGIVGAPGAGKSTLAQLLAEAFAEGVPDGTGVVDEPKDHFAAWVPMDGYHLADVELSRLGRLERKGAIDTFDARGYRSLLRRIHEGEDGVIYAPMFERDLEQPLAGAIPVFPWTRLVVTEGNYLLDETDAWKDVRAAMTEVWYVDVDDELRRERLVERHIRFGKEPEQARKWVMEVDEVNARRIAACRDRANATVSLPPLDL